MLIILRFPTVDQIIAERCQLIVHSLFIHCVKHAVIGELEIQKTSAEQLFEMIVHCIFRATKFFGEFLTVGIFIAKRMESLKPCCVRQKFQEYNMRFRVVLVKTAFDDSSCKNTHLDVYIAAILRNKREGIEEEKAWMDNDP